MATVQTQIRIEDDVKKQAVEIPKYKPKVLDAMEETRQISRDPNTKRYGSFAEALEDIDL